MKSYVDTIKATVSLAYRLEDDAFYNGEYETIVHMISLIHERTLKEVKTDLQVFADAAKKREKEGSPIFETKRFTLCGGGLAAFDREIAQRVELYEAIQKGYPNEEFLYIVAQLYELLKNDYLLLEERGSDSEIRKVIKKVKEEEELAELEHRREIGPP